MAFRSGCSVLLLVVVVIVVAVVVVVVIVVVVEYLAFLGRSSSKIFGAQW